MMTLDKSNAIGDYSLYMSYLWELTSKDIFPKSVEIPNKFWEEYIDALWIGHNQNIPYKIINPTLISNNSYVSKESNKVVVGFSGGKDSLTVALKLQEQGFVPIMYHIKGLTRSTSYTEALSAREVAIEGKWEYIEKKINYKGKTKYIESPVRNHLVLSYIIDYMIENNLNKAGMGLEIEDKVLNTTIETRIDNGFSDGIDFTQLFVKAIRETFPEFVLYDAVGSKISDTIWLFDKYRNIAMKSNSCMMTDRIKTYKRNNKMTEFGIHNLPKYNCLCCKKCCQDYIVLYKAGLLGDMTADNLEDALKSCYKTIRNKIKSLMGERKKEINNVRDDDLINYIIKDYNTYINNYKKNKSSIEKDLRLFTIEPNNINIL